MLHAGPQGSVWRLSNQVGGSTRVLTMLRTDSDARMLQQRVVIPRSVWPKFLVAGVMSRDTKRGPCFMVTELGPEYVRKLMTMVNAAATYPRNLAVPNILEFTDPYNPVDQQLPTKFYEWDGGDISDFPEYEDTLYQIESRNVTHMLLDEDPTDADIEGGEWASLEGEEHPVIRFDTGVAIVNYEMLMSDGDLITSLDVAISTLWKAMGSAQPFYYDVNGVSTFWRHSW